MSRRLLVPVSTAAVAVALLSACSNASPGSASTSSPAPSGATSTASPTGSGSDAAPTYAPVSGTPAPDDVTAAVTADLTRFASATTGAEACSAVSAQFGTFLGGGSYAGCPSHISETLGGSLFTGKVEVSSVVMSLGDAVARASISPTAPHENNYFFIQEKGQWKLNSWGERR